MQHVFGVFHKFVHVDKGFGGCVAKFVNMYKFPEMKKESAEADS